MAVAKYYTQLLARDPCKTVFVATDHLLQEKKNDGTKATRWLWPFQKVTRPFIRQVQDESTRLWLAQAVEVIAYIYKQFNEKNISTLEFRIWRLKFWRNIMVLFVHHKNFWFTLYSFQEGVLEWLEGWMPDDPWKRFRDALIPNARKGFQLTSEKIFGPLPAYLWSVGIFKVLL